MLLEFPFHYPVIFLPLLKAFFRLVLCVLLSKLTLVAVISLSWWWNGRATPSSVFLQKRPPGYVGGTHPLCIIQAKLDVWSVSAEGQREGEGHSRGWVTPKGFGDWRMSASWFSFIYLFIFKGAVSTTFALTFYSLEVLLWQQTVPQVCCTAGGRAWSPLLNMRETKPWGLVCSSNARTWYKMWQKLENYFLIFINLTWCLFILWKKMLTKKSLNNQ